MKQHFQWSLLIAGLLLASGCGPKGPEIATVEGTIKMDGQPLPNASVVFIPENGRPAGAWTDENGHYVLNFGSGRKGALPGKHKVSISTFREGGQNEDGSMAPSQKETVPMKFNKLSELTFEVVAEKNNVADFEITSEGKIDEGTTEN